MKWASLAALAAGLLVPLAPTRTVSFDDQKAGEVPKGFSCALTGKGRPGTWAIVADPTAPTPPQVLGQTDEDATGYRFPVCVLDAVSAADVDLSVRFRPVKGSADQAAGIVWRFRDRDNYYLLRANALENNLVLYKVEAGKRSDLKPKGSGMFAYGRKAKVPSGAWSTLRIVARGPLFEAYLNGEKLFEVEDRTFAGAGKVGVWTKADSVTYFDDLKVVVPGK
jgi:3-keto-disaccharide hydrolase